MRERKLDRCLAQVLTGAQLPGAFIEPDNCLRAILRPNVESKRWTSGAPHSCTNGRAVVFLWGMWAGTQRNLPPPGPAMQ